SASLQMPACASVWLHPDVSMFVNFPGPSSPSACSMSTSARSSVARPTRPARHGRKRSWGAVVSTRFANRVRSRLGPVGRAVARTKVSPNALTVAGLLLNVGVAAVIASGNLILGGVLVLIAGAFDALDGAVARATGQTSAFGGFLDSTVDRYSEAVD